MRAPLIAVLAVLVVPGCRQILGIEDLEEAGSADGASGDGPVGDGDVPDAPQASDAPSCSGACDWRFGAPSPTLNDHFGSIDVAHDVLGSPFFEIANIAEPAPATPRRSSPTTG